MNQVKFLLVFAAAMLIGPAAVSGEEEPRWQDLCKGSANPYCPAVGKDAYNNDSHPIPLRGLKLGKVIGVVWIKANETVSSAGEGLRVAPSNDYYYIIDNSIAEPFLRLCSETEVKTELKDAGFNSD